MAPVHFTQIILCLSAFLATATIDVSVDTTARLHPMNPLYLGCHSDSGFVHEVTGWSSQMVFGESFERPPNSTRPGQSSYAWQKVVDPALGAGRVEISLDQSRRFANFASQRIRIDAANDTSSVSTATATAGIANRGLGNEGLYFQGGKRYEGYFFARSSEPVTLQARLETTDGRVLASQTIEHTPSSSQSDAFVRYVFELTPLEGTECVGIAPGTEADVHCTDNPNTAHVCIKCGGQLTIALVEPSSDTAPVEVNVAFVVLQPGEWGRFKGLNARKDVAETLIKMGIKAIRLGGSFCSVTADNGEYYQWQKWTGPVWERPSVGAHWNSYGNDAYNLIGGWGPFEMIDYAVALGAEPIITTTMTSSPEELADLVEYLWGNTTTNMGKKRSADGHPEVYPLKFIELGNEQYNQGYIAQVRAMETRADEIGAGGILNYIFPDNAGVRGADIKAAAALGLGRRLVTDVHVGANGGLAAADSLFEAHSAGGLRDDAVANFETNAGSHHHGRALDEAADLNAFFNRGDSRVLARTASFCHGRSGHFDMFDQAISFFLPNMTWIQPPGYVHAMITESWQPTVVNTTAKVNPQPPNPSWASYSNLGYTCSGEEYRGYATMETNSPAGCLAAAEKMAAQGINYATYPGNNNCYVCVVTGNVTSKLASKPNATSFVGTNVKLPTSVSAQLSDDGKTAVVRIVHFDTQPSEVVVSFNEDFTVRSASAQTMSSDDLEAENTAAVVDHVSPCNLAAAIVGSSSVRMTVPAQSYTTLTVSQLQVK